MKPLQFSLLLIMMAILGIGTCSLTYKLSKKPYYTMEPPGTVEIGLNLYYDDIEMTNMGWREYMYWTQRVYGIHSEEYKATLPDTLAWIRDITCGYVFVEYNLRHPAYAYYPVVGVSQQQAIDYSKWRSDRVFEVLLVRNGEINWDTSQTSETYFTIERYFSGVYKDLNPEKDFTYYPNYRLPTISEWKQAMHYNDSISRQKCPTYIQAEIVPCVDDSTIIEPIIDVDGGCAVRRKKNPIYHLKGNVSEWTSQDNVTVGGGWANYKNEIYSQDTFIIMESNAWTGFRNVCEWKKYEPN